MRNKLYAPSQKKFPILPSMILVIVITAIGYFFFIDRNSPILGWIFSKLPPVISQPISQILPTQIPNSTAIISEVSTQNANINKLVPTLSVVQIIAQVEKNNNLVNAWWGSGTVISQSGLIISNSHIVSSTRGSQVKNLLVGISQSVDQPPSLMYYATVVQSDRNTDLAVLQIIEDINHNPVNKENLGLKFASLGDSDSINLGDDISILGYPSLEGSTISMTPGIISGFTPQEPFGSRAFIKTNAIVGSGSSGGLVANEKGEIIAIPTQFGFGGPDSLAADCAPGSDQPQDNCLSSGINALRPINLANSLINKALNGQISVDQTQFIAEPFSRKNKPVYKDTFNNPSSGWFAGVSDFGTANYVNKTYILQTIPPNKMYSVTHDPNLTDSVVSVVNEVKKSTSSGGYGLLCRANSDGSSFYGFELTTDGYYRIFKMIQNKVYFLTYWNPINTKIDKTNKITFSCIGNEMSGIMNGDIIIKANDDQLKTGKNGLLVSTLNEGNFIVGYTNYEVDK